MSEGHLMEGPSEEVERALRTGERDAAPVEDVVAFLRREAFRLMYTGEMMDRVQARAEIVRLYPGIVEYAFGRIDIRPWGIKNLAEAGYAEEVSMAVGDRRTFAQDAFMRDLLRTEWMLSYIEQQIRERDDPELVNEAMTIMNRRARMLGYDAPEKLHILSGQDMSEITEETRRLLLAAKDEVEEFERQLLAGGDVVEGEFEEEEDE